jgi:hypothetical protein
MFEIEDSNLIAAYTYAGHEYELRQNGDRYFGVFPNAEATVMTEPKETVSGAAESALAIAEIL